MSKQIVGYRVIQRKTGYILQVHINEIVSRGFMSFPDFQDYYEDRGTYKTKKQALKAKKELMMENDDLIVD